MHSPKKQAVPLIRKDRPWERIPYMTINGWNLLRDSVTGEFSRHHWQAAEGRHEDRPAPCRVILSQTIGNTSGSCGLSDPLIQLTRVPLPGRGIEQDSAVDTV